MSSANVNLVRSIYADWERGDFSSVEWAHPEVEFAFPDGPSPGSLTGVAEMAESYREFLGAWKEHRVQAEEYRELDDERVLVLNRSRGRGKTSGLDLAQMRAEGANLFHIRDGKVTRLVLYFNRERAFAGLGLAPQGDVTDPPQEATGSIPGA
ncbi:MAG: nuclear transport factor 2 family protein [Actinomycetota bacterium]|nr:nuclear transport factor 2 family protein [Actinomycetota bacterium]